MTNNLDLEARLHGTAHSEHPQELRLWLRLLTCTQLIEKQIRTELRLQFDTTLPRFDLMAQLERNPEGLKMNDLSRRMMVSGGNITGITDQLVTEALVERMAVDGDRRSFRIKLTAKGQASFAEMAAAHENWIVDAFAALKNSEITHLRKLLGQVKQHSLKASS